MYNWSVDEEKFKKHPPPVRKTISFLKTNPWVQKIAISRMMKSRNELILRPAYTLKVKLNPLVHPVIKTTLAKTLQEMDDHSGLSVVEKK